MSESDDAQNSKALVVRQPGALIPAAGRSPAAVAQTSNVALGDLAGGSIHKNVNIEGDVIVAPQETPLSRLYRDLRARAEGDEHLTDYIAQLQVFTRVVENEEVVGLDEKLQAAGRGAQLDMAKAMKEMIYAQLRANMFSRTFQTIYATLMGKVFEAFESHVRPAIVGGAAQSEVDGLVHHYVVSPIVAELDKCPECNDAPVQTVRGMMYFLTGNCHLKWH